MDAGVGACGNQSWLLCQKNHIASSWVSRRRQVVMAGGVYQGPSTTVCHCCNYKLEVNYLDHTRTQGQSNHPHTFCTACPPPCSNLKHHKCLSLLILDHMFLHQELMCAPSQTISMLLQGLYLAILPHQFSTLCVMVLEVIKW